MSAVAGLDWSMTCPSICIWDKSKPFKFSNCVFYFYIDNKKYDKSFGNIHGFKAELYQSEQERFDNISEWAMTIMRKHKVKQACLEGYSMGSSGRIFNIAENIGLLKHKMWKEGIEFITPAPTTVKKHFSGKGNAKKEDLHSKLLESEGINVSEILNSKISTSPVSDIVDSYAMVSYYITNS
jgi:Holliday junction resolvasome RuvABC endonuclease subunit